MLVEQVEFKQLIQIKDLTAVIPYFQLLLPQVAVAVLELVVVLLLVTDKYIVGQKTEFYFLSEATLMVESLSVLTNPTQCKFTLH